MTDYTTSRDALIPYASRLVGTTTTNTVNARDLHEFLQVKTKFSDWIQRRIQQYGFSQDIDFTVFSEMGRDYNVLLIEYFLTFDMCKELSMVERTPKGKEARQYFLDCERRAQSDTLPVLHDPAYQMLLKAIVDLDATRHQIAQIEATQRQQDRQLIETQRQAIEALQASQQANAKSDLAIKDVHSMTITDYVMKNGLLRQYPPSSWQIMGQWLKNFCEQRGITVDKVPVYGKTWTHENRYPLGAFGAFAREDMQRLKQPRLIRLEKPEPPEESA